MANYPVESQIVTEFTWDYVDERPPLRKLYEKGKTSQWNATTDIDWTPEVNFGEPRENPFEGMGFDGPDTPVGQLSEEQRNQFRWEFQSWMVSQFMHGEQGALVATARLVETVPDLDAKFYAANQVADEAQHAVVAGSVRRHDRGGARRPRGVRHDAAQLMRERFLLEDVWERVGVDVATGREFALNNPLMAVFRQTLFSKIVPNLNKLGLLTDRVRPHFEQLGILDFASGPDSATEHEPELVEGRA